MKKTKQSPRVFISHASTDKAFAESIANALRGKAMRPWIDKEKVLVGDDVLEKLGEGLRTMDVLLVVVSQKALTSGWVERELKFATRREIEEQQILILPFIIDSTLSSELPWYLQHLRADKVSADESGIAAIVEAVEAKVSRRFSRTSRKSSRKTDRDPKVDKTIRDIEVGGWEKATDAALEILSDTDATGGNHLFEALLTYQNLPDDNKMLWSALHTIEMCADMAPDLMTRSRLSQMAGHSNFTVRSAAASICMRWSQFAPDRVPVDIVSRLSVHDEDWYVQAPANAALKTLARPMPGVLAIFYSRLRSDDADERSHSAACILDIAQNESDILDRDDLEAVATHLRSVGDHDALDYIQRSLGKVTNKEAASRFKYGI